MANRRLGTNLPRRATPDIEFELIPNSVVPIDVEVPFQVEIKLYRRRSLYRRRLQASRANLSSSMMR
jgi:hypothetical protein